MRKTTAGAVVATAFTFVGIGLAASPAAADVDVKAGSCDGPNICLFENNDFNQGNESNHWQDFQKDISNFSNWNWRNSDDGMNDETSSIKNRRGCTVTLYQDKNYDGDSSPFAAGANDGYLANNNVGDNSASSLDSHCD